MSDDYGDGTIVDQYKNECWLLSVLPFFREISGPSGALSLCERGHFCERTPPVAEVWEVTRGLEPTSTHQTQFSLPKFIYYYLAGIYFSKK